VACGACSAPPRDPPRPAAAPDAAGVAAAPDAAPPRRLVDGVAQLVVAETADWDATEATLVRYARAGDGWAAVGEPVAAVLGGGGSGWGIGLHGDGAPAGRRGPVKREGDGRSPAGAFQILRAVGRAARPVPGTGIPYQAMDRGWRCVDDPASRRYNHLFDADGEPVDWTSAEDMLAYGEAYRWVIEVDHNHAGGAAVPGAGSCIFLHVGDASAGCTAMPRAAIEALLAWLEPGAVYVLLPAAERDALAAAWGLP
jgi:hypothetical protein